MPKSLLNWERRRFESPEVKMPRAEDQMGLSLVESDDPFGVHLDGEVAEAVVEAHWEGGSFVPKERLKMKEVKKTLNRTRTTRLGKRGTRKEVVDRLRLRPKAGKVWIPSKLSDCYDLTHQGVISLVDGFFVRTVDCKVCERVMAVISGRHPPPPKPSDGLWDPDKKEEDKWEKEIGGPRSTWLVLRSEDEGEGPQEEVDEV
jgi:hypothetical protein